MRPDNDGIADLLARRSNLLEQQDANPFRVRSYRQAAENITALFPNTQRAHELAKVKDWVMIDYQRNDVENQCPAVTTARGLLQERRVIRGRETECRKYSADQTS